MTKNEWTVDYLGPVYEEPDDFLLVNFRDQSPEGRGIGGAQYICSKLVKQVRQEVKAKTQGN